MLGRREENIYGNTNYEELLKIITEHCNKSSVNVDFYQSNIEGDIVTEIQESLDFDGIIINPAAYTHTSIAIYDALKLFSGRIVEVHLSNIHAREGFREKSVTAGAVTGVITGLGVHGYLLGVDYLVNS